jgi:type I restriction enzyme S subunit
MTTTYLPYPAYQPSGIDWLGNIPSGWKAISLRHLAKIKNGSDFKHIEVEEGGYPVLGSGGEFARVSAFMFDKPSVLLGRKGTIDNPLYIEEPFWTVDTLFYTEIQENTYPKFFYYFCKTIPFSFFQYGSTVPSMTQNDLYSVRVSFPSLLEQQQIAAFLDRETAKIDQLIAKQQQLIELLKEKRQAVISHAVTKGLNPDVKMQPSGVEWLGDVPEHWDIRSVSRLSSKITNGYVGPTRDILVSTGVPYVQATHIKNGKVNFDDAYFVREAWSNSHAKSILKEGDVLIVQTGAGTGDVGIVTKDEEGFNCHALIILQPINEVISGEFLSTSLQSQYGYSVLYSIRTGGMHPHLNCGEVQYVKLPIPSRVEQDAIIQYLRTQNEKFDVLMEKAQRQIGLLRERRAALISAAVTGKIDVREVALLA